VTGRKDARVSSADDFTVGEWVAQPSLNSIAQPGTTRHLEPQVMDLLTFLARSAGRVVSKDAIIDGVWQGRFISESTLTRSIADLRRALGDDQRTPRYIETIPKRGYRLVARVSADEVALGAAQRDAGAPSDRDGSERVASHERIADRLAATRRKRFVGRAPEIDLFRTALVADELPFAVLHLNGPGGVGKTTLLHELVREAKEAGRALVQIDGRNIEPSAEGFLAAVSQAIGADGVDLPTIVGQWPRGALLFVDTSERLAASDEWLRQTFLPQLPARTLVVIAGRDEPAASWRTDAAWGTLTRTRVLGNLSDEESRRYLTTCEVPIEHQEHAVAFTRGHPLALSLIADMLTRPDRFAPSRFDNEPEIVRLLLEAFVQKIPSPDHRLALHACVTAWATTETLLAAVLERSDVHDIFDWLARLPFVEHGPGGLFPHDLARDVLYADFRSRDPDAAYRVTERVLGSLYERLDRARGLAQQRAWFDIIFIQRNNAALRPVFEWASFGTAYAETATAAERTSILEMVERHEGHASAAIAGYWLARQPDAFRAVRRVGGGMIGFLALLTLDTITPEDAEADPAIAQAALYAQRHGPPRAGELITYGRFWMDAERHQAITPVFGVVAAISSQSWMGPRVSWSFVAMAHPDLMEPMFTEIRIWRVRDADFEVGGRRYGVFAHDWRVEDAQAWLRLKAERAVRIESALPARNS
jgi:DNA-binding winged helix-turn-helix (wHTH) protein